MLARARVAGVSRVLVPAMDVASSRRVLAVTTHDDGVYAAVGVHPTEAAGVADDTLHALRDLAVKSKVVAVGEIGLDYYWASEAGLRARQRALLERQLDLAQGLKLPVILHMRESNDATDGPCAQDLLEILSSWVGALRSQQGPLAARPGVLHSFAGTLESANQAISLGFYIGVTGPVTFKNADARREVVSKLPLDRILVETDSPFLAPVPHRGKRNEPAFVTHIADKIAEIQSRSVAEVASITEGNAARLFAWGESV